MTKSAPDDGSAYNAQIIKEFRANQGRAGGPRAGTALILIHHLGARSGVERVTPLGCSAQPDGRFVIVASSGGSPTHPDWYYNLKAHPRITVEAGAQTFTVLADELAAPPAPSCGRSWSRNIPLLASTRSGPRGSFRCSCLPARTELRREPPADPSDTDQPALRDTGGAAPGSRSDP